MLMRGFLGTGFRRSFYLGCCITCGGRWISGASVWGCWSLAAGTDTRAARKFLRKLLKSSEYTPRVLITDKLCSYGAAKREVMASVEHRQSKYLNNRAENSHQCTRLREYAMRRFASPGHASRFCAVHDPIYQHFRPPQHQLDAAAHRAILTRPSHHLEPDHRRPAEPGALNCGLKQAPIGTPARPETVQTQTQPTT